MVLVFVFSESSLTKGLSKWIVISAEKLYLFKFNKFTFENKEIYTTQKINLNIWTWFSKPVGCQLIVPPRKWLAKDPEIAERNRTNLPSILCRKKIMLQLQSRNIKFNLYWKSHPIIYERSGSLVRWIYDTLLGHLY